MFRVSNGVCGLLCFGGYVEMSVDVLSKFIVVGEPTTLCLVSVWGGGFCTVASLLLRVNVVEVGDDFMVSLVEAPVDKCRIA